MRSSENVSKSRHVQISQSGLRIQLLKFDDGFSITISIRSPEHLQELLYRVFQGRAPFSISAGPIDAQSSVQWRTYLCQNWPISMRRLTGIFPRAPTHVSIKNYTPTSQCSYGWERDSRFYEFGRSNLESNTLTRSPLLQLTDEQAD